MLIKRALLVVCLVVFGACSGGSPKETCNDGKDNDSNGEIDCADPHCGLGATCDAAGLTCAGDLTCSVCSGNGGQAQVLVETVCGDGFDNDCDGLVDCDDPQCQPTTEEPGATCDQFGQTCSAPDHEGKSTCGTSTNGETNALGWIRFVGSDYYVLGAFGSGYQEQAILTFQVFAADGQPYQTGLKVSFAHEPQGGSFIGITRDCRGTPLTCAAEDVTDDEGKVTVVLSAGRRFASLAVQASATADGVTRSLTGGNITVVGAKPNGAHLSLTCELHNVPALTHTDCLYSNYCGGALDNGNDPCTLKMADRHGIAIGVPTFVTFQAEAGTVPPATVSPAYGQATPSGDLGHADFYYEFCNSPLPFDVTPLTGELSYQGDWGCGTRTANPRDGLSTLIAMVEGEEGFVDENLSGTYDPGEPFIDLGEPFVDIDDDGVRDPEEWFLDVDDDGNWDEPNRTWDADTILWTQTRLLYTGYPQRVVAGQNELFSRFHLGGMPPSPTPLAPAFSVNAEPPTSMSYDFFFTDQNLNPLTSLATYDVSSGSHVTVALTGPFGTVDSIGTSFRQLYCDKPTFSATTSCEDGPAAQACKASPCYVVWDVGGCNSGTCSFQYGNDAVVTITGAEPGDDVVWVNATIEDVVSSFGIGGTCLP
jgi:hypothetical protein